MMNPNTSPNAPTQDSAFSIPLPSFPYTQMPSVLMPNNPQYGVQYFAPGGGVFPRGGPASTNMLSVLSGSSALGVCSNANVVQREHSSQGSCVQQSQVMIGNSPGLPVGLWPAYSTNVLSLQRSGRTAQEPIARENQDQPVADSHPGFANWVELRAQTAPSTQEKNPNMLQSSLSRPASSASWEHSSSTAEIEGLQVIEGLQLGFPVDTYPRSPSPIGGCPRPTSQQQERWNIGRLRQWQEENNGEAEMVEDEKKAQTNASAHWRRNLPTDYKRGSCSKKKSAVEKLEKIRFHKWCSKLYGFQAPLHHAILMNDMNKVRQLLKTSNPNSYHGETGETPMHLACRLGKLNFVKLLRRHPKIDMNLTTISGVKAPSRPGSNAMNLAIKFRKADVVNFLVQFKPKEELSDLVYALNQEQEKIRKELDKLKPKIDILKEENKDLKKKIKEVELEDANVMGARLPREKPTNTKNLAEVLKIVRELERELTAHQQRIWSEKEDEKQCTICAERQKDTVLVPCGHFFCSVCSMAVPICPNCRKRIERRVKTFDSSI